MIDQHYVNNTVVGIAIHVLQDTDGIPDLTPAQQKQLDEYRVQYRESTISKWSALDKVFRTGSILNETCKLLFKSGFISNVFGNKAFSTHDSLSSLLLGQHKRKIDNIVEMLNYSDNSTIECDNSSLEQVINHIHTLQDGYK